MKVNLKEIASIQTGYSFRARLESVEVGGISVIQMKDLTTENRVDCTGLMRVDVEILKNHHLVKQGDLVFRSRGQVTTSAILHDDPGEAVVAAPLLRIRVTDIDVLPEYLNWFINKVSSQAYLASCSAGTALKMITKQALEEMEVVVPSMKRQKTIIELAVLAEEEQSIMKKLIEKRSQYVSTMLNKLVEGE